MFYHWYGLAKDRFLFEKEQKGQGGEELSRKHLDQHQPVPDSDSGDQTPVEKKGPKRNHPVCQKLSPGTRIPCGGTAGPDGLCQKCGKPIED